MAANPGEDNVATLFADIHYFYGPPTNKPPHHRFDKGSYVYLFENASQRRARIEVANQPGTDDQDAFEGFLDQTRVSYTYRHQCVVSITVNQAGDPSVWHLPTFDPRNENKYHYPLHSLDIYFWTKQDALQFIDGIRRLLPPSQLDVEDEPAPPPHPTNASAVVQQLENMAIADPNYHAPQPPPQAAPIQYHQQQAPISAVATEQAQQSFAPMAYNPAAPAAPEQIRPREKTPPPEDGGMDPLAQAVAYDAQAPFSPGFVPPPGFQSSQQAGGFPGPPSAIPGPPGPGGLQRSVTMPVASPGSGSIAYPGSPGFQPPPPPPGGPGQSSTPHSQHSPSAIPSAPSASAPPGGYSQYSYAQQQQQRPTDPSAYSVHSSFYTPTEAEANKYKDYNKGKESKEGKDGEGGKKLEENFGRLEKGMTGIMKRFEKKFG